MESRYGSAVRVRFDGLLEPPQPPWPEVPKKGVEDLQGFEVDGIEPVLALSADVHQAGVGQDVQVLRHRLLGDVEVPADLSCRTRPVPDQSKHRLPAGLRQCPEEGLATHDRQSDSCRDLAQALTFTSLCLYVAAIGTNLSAQRRRRMTNDSGDALSVARAYHQAWTRSDFQEADGYLSEDLETDVPINTYRSKSDWLDAVRGTRQIASRVHVLAEFGNDDEALLLYDMLLDPIGDLRVAEHFVVAEGRIVKIRHVHDTAALRAAGFARGGG